MRKDADIAGINDWRDLLKIIGTNDPSMPPRNAPMRARVKAPQKFPRNFTFNRKTKKVAAVVALIK